MTQKTSSPAASKRSPYSHLFRISHWLLSISVVALIITGAALHAVSRPDWSLIGGYPTWCPSGRAVFHHQLWGILLAPAVLLGTVEFLMARGIRRTTRPRWMANYVLMFAALLCLLTAIPLLYACRSDSLYHLSRGTHAITGLVVIPVALLVHIFQALTRRRALLVPIYAPIAHARWATLLWIPVVGVAAYALLQQLPAKRSGTCGLTATHVTTVPENPAELSWDQANPLTLKLSNGHGFDRGRTEVTLRALYSDTELFVQAQWQDPKEDTQYWPWRKTADGWTHLVTNAKDEQVYYEDKFSMVFPIKRDALFEQFGCAVHCHQTTRMPYGLKGTDENHPVDVWHWKASRTDPVGYVDDKYWQGRDLNAKEGGRKSDPMDSGGFVKNVNEDNTLPKWLPSGADAVRRGAILKDHAAPYSAEAAAQFAPGDEIPGIVIARAIGDRGDVGCQTSYANGRWQLLIRRRLDTGSDYDVVFEPGGRYAFGCAAFDHSAKRHAYNHRVYTLTLAK